MPEGVKWLITVHMATVSESPTAPSGAVRRDPSLKGSGALSRTSLHLPEEGRQGAENDDQIELEAVTSHIFDVELQGFLHREPAAAADLP